MGVASLVSAREPLSEINTTPLIDVLLVLLIVFVMSIPIATNSLEVALPAPRPTDTVVVDPIRNLLAIESDGDLTWNGQPIDERGLTGLLAQARAMSPEPEVQFHPEASASYARSAEVLLIVKQSQIGNFGFVGNEQYRLFGKP